MSILDQGCNCESCLKMTKQKLQIAREKWDNGEREIKIKPYHYQCGDGCCNEYGTNVFVNGFDLNCDADNVESVLENLLEFLNINDVDVRYEYEDEYDEE